MGSPRPAAAYARQVRDRETIDAELRLIAAVRRSLAEEGAPMPSTAVIDELLDERGNQPSRLVEDESRPKGPKSAETPIS